MTTALFIILYSLFIILPSPVFAGELTNQFTISIWVNPTTSIATKALVVKDTEVRLVTDASGNPACQIYASGAWQTAITSSTALSLNTWTHVSCTYDKANIRVFVNGTQTGTGAQTNALNDAATNLLVGQDDGGTYGNFIGTTDNLMVYSYARTAKQIVEDMNAGHPAVGSPVGSAVGHWKFDEGFGTTANNSGNGGSTLNGALTSMASPATATSGWTQSGKFGKGLVFDGSNDYVDAGSAVTISSNNLTVCAWVKPAVTSRGDIVTRWNSGVGNSQFDLLYGLTTGKPQFYITDGTAPGIKNSGVGSTTMSTGQWYHICGTYDGVTVAVYLNGNLESSTAASITLNTTSLYNYRIGDNSQNGNSSSGVSPLNGSIDEVKVYNYALTADEVKVDMNKGQSQVMGALSDNSSYQVNAANQEYCIPGDTTSCAAPVGRWDFEEGTGNTVNDKSGNANTGTWNGTGTSHWKPGKVGSGGNFNGSDDYVSVGSMTIPTTGTIEYWWNPQESPTANNHPVFTARTSSPIKTFDMYPYSDGIFYAGWYNDGNDDRVQWTTSGISQNTWYHVALTWTNGGTTTLYVNGQSKGTTSSLNATWDTSTTTSYIGNDANAASTTPKMLLDQVRIFNYARSAAQVAWDYNRGAPVGHWKFDECQGDRANDSSGNSNTGTITVGASGTQTAVGTCTGSAGTLWKDGATGKYNSSLDFDGTDDYISVPDNNSLDVGDVFTLSAWVKRGATGAVHQIFNRGANGTFVLAFIANDKLELGSHNVATIVNSTTTITDTTTWHHLVATKNGSTVKLYIDGNDVTGTVTNSTTGNTTSALNIGRNSDGSQYFNGQIDDPRIYNYALTATQVKGLYNGGAVRFGPSSGTP